MKFDGYRAQVAISGSEVVVYTRNGHDWTRQFKVIVPPCRPDQGLGADRRRDRRHRKARAARNFSMLKTGIAAGMPLKFYAFDLFERTAGPARPAAHSSARATGATHRRARCPATVLQFSSHIVDNGKEVFDAMCAGGHEGVIAKRADSRYIGDRTLVGSRSSASSGRSSSSAVIGRATAGEGMASLILGTYERGQAHLSRPRRHRLHRRDAQTHPRAARAAPHDQAGFRFRPSRHRAKARWVKPELVAEVAYAEMTPDGSLRHPSFQGMREDKRATRW